MEVELDKRFKLLTYRLQGGCSIAELIQLMADTIGFEPITPSLTAKSSTVELGVSMLATHEGIEPSISAVTGRRLHQLSYEPLFNYTQSKLYLPCIIKTIC